MVARDAVTHGLIILAAAVLVILGLFVWNGSGEASLRLILIVVLAALLVVELLLLRRQARAEAEASLIADEGPVGPEEEPAWQPGWAGAEGTSGASGTAAPAAEPAQHPWPMVAIRCSRCQNVFRVADGGLRPLTVACTNCGKEGVIRGKSHA